MKAIIIPDLDMLLDTNKPLSTTIDINETITDGGYMIEKVEVKDIRHYFHIMAKGNPSYLEPMFSDYYLIDDEFIHEFEYFRRHMDDYTYNVKDKMIRAVYGMSREKEHALTKDYPSKIDLIEKYGYDSKQIMHILRLYLFARDYYLLDSNFKSAITVTDNPLGHDKSYLLKVKKYGYDLKVVENLATNYIKLLSEIREKFKRDNTLTNRYIDNFDIHVKCIIKKHIKSDLE